MHPRDLMMPPASPIAERGGGSSSDLVGLGLRLPVVSGAAFEF